MHFIRWLFVQAPEIPLFLSLALGFYFGKINFYKFKFGGVAGSLIFAVILGYFGVHIDSGVKSFLFAIFIYAVGYESGPTFFSSLGRNSIREILMCIIMFVVALSTIVIVGYVFHLDKGLAAGLAAGGFTQSAIIGTASDALSKMGFSPAQLSQLQANIASGYAVSYVTGVVIAIIVCLVILPAFMKRGIHEDALAEELLQKTKDKSLLSFNVNQTLALSHIEGRVYHVGSFSKKTVAQFEEESCNISRGFKRYLTIELILSHEEEFSPQPDYILKDNDQILVVGPRDLMAACEPLLGKEILDSKELQLVMTQLDVIITKSEAVGTLPEVLNRFTHEVRHGAYISRIWKNDQLTLLNNETIINKGDVIRFFGLEHDVKRMASHFGVALASHTKIDYVYMGFGLVAGFLIGMIVWKINGTIPLTLGSGGGCLLSGLIFGYFRSRKKTFGELPSASLQFMKDIGLAGFVACIGLNSSIEAIHTIQIQGFSLFLLGLLVTTVPLLITMFIGRYLLGYKNTAVLAGALSGCRSANPAFGEILNVAGNSVPTVSFAITYSIANVLLTLIGPLVVAIIK